MWKFKEPTKKGQNFYYVFCLSWSEICRNIFGGYKQNTTVLYLSEKCANKFEPKKYIYKATRIFAQRNYEKIKKLP